MTDQGKNVENEELARLRHRAYSREGTSEDRDRLAELEAALQVIVPPEHGDAVDEQDAPADELPGDRFEEASWEGVGGRTNRLSRLGIIAAITALALFVGGFVGFGLGVSATSEQLVEVLREQTVTDIPGLRWFDRENAGGEPLPFDVEEVTGLEDPLVRDVAMMADSAMVEPWRILVSRGANEFGEVKVCLIASNDDVEKIACSTEDEFILGSGLALGVGTQIVGWLPSTDMLLFAPL